MSPYEQISHSIEEEAKSITSELIEIRMYDVDRLQAMLQVRLKQSITKSLKLFEIEGEKQLSALLDKQAIVGTGDQRLNGEIRKLSEKIKEARRALHTMRDWDEYLSLKKYIRTRFGDDVMPDFYKSIGAIIQERKKKHSISIPREHFKK